MELGPVQKEWVKMLKEKPHRQTTGILGEKKNNGHVKACCLGQLLLCANKEVREDDGQIFDDGEPECLSQSWQELGLRSEEGLLKNRDSREPTQRSLADMNDGGWTWPQIGEFVENNPELVFTKSY